MLSLYALSSLSVRGPDCPNAILVRDLPLRESRNVWGHHCPAPYFVKPLCHSSFSCVSSFTTSMKKNMKTSSPAAKQGGGSIDMKHTLVVNGILDAISFVTCFYLPIQELSSQPRNSVFESISRNGKQANYSTSKWTCLNTKISMTAITQCCFRFQILL